MNERVFDIVGRVKDDPNPEWMLNIGARLLLIAYWFLGIDIESYGETSDES